jgi:hypothetical protein
VAFANKICNTTCNPTYISKKYLLHFLLSSKADCCSFSSCAATTAIYRPKEVSSGGWAASKHRSNAIVYDYKDKEAVLNDYQVLLNVGSKGVFIVLSS